MMTIAALVMPVLLLQIMLMPLNDEQEESNKFLP